VTRGKNGVTLIDLENATGLCAEEGTRATNALVRGSVPRGDYVGIRWTFGVPFALNHTDTVGAPAPLNSAAMAWSWQFGRKFAKIDLGAPNGASDGWQEPAFFVHVGSTGCTGSPETGETVNCRAPNRTTVRLRSFDPARQKIVVDLRKLVAGDDLKVNGGDAPGCMSGPADPECGSVFGALGIRWPGQSTPKQSVFRAIRR
jgi:uncharacterized repeat protein (TIGR04052 family)